MLSISHMKLLKRSKKLKLNLDIEFGRAVLSTISVSRWKLWNKLSDPCLKRRGRNHRTLSSYLVPVEKIFIKRRGKNRPVPFFIPPHFSYKQPLSILQLMLNEMKIKENVGTKRMNMHQIDEYFSERLTLKLRECCHCYGH